MLYLMRNFDSNAFRIIVAFRSDRKVSTTIRQRSATRINLLKKDLDANNPLLKRFKIDPPHSPADWPIVEQRLVAKFSINLMFGNRVEISKTNDHVVELLRLEGRKLKLVDAAWLPSKIVKVMVDSSVALYLFTENLEVFALSLQTILIEDKLVAQNLQLRIKKDHRIHSIDAGLGCLAVLYSKQKEKKNQKEGESVHARAKLQSTYYQCTPSTSPNRSMTIACRSSMMFAGALQRRRSFLMALFWQLAMFEKSKEYLTEYRMCHKS